MVWAADSRKPEQPESEYPVNSIDKEFRNQANDRIYELEQRFETLCAHLKISVRKPYGYQVSDFNGLGAGTQNAPMSGKTLAEVSAEMASAKNVG